MKKTLALGVVLAALAVSGCGGSLFDSDKDASAAPAISTVSLDKTSAAQTDTVTVTVKVAGVNLVDPDQNPTNVAGEGHWHVYLDSTSTDDMGSGGFAGDSLAFQVPTGTPQGGHTIIIALMNNDHTPFNPAVEKSVSITVTP